MHVLSLSCRRLSCCLPVLFPRNVRLNTGLFNVSLHSYSSIPKSSCFLRCSSPRLDQPGVTYSAAPLPSPSTTGKRMGPFPGRDHVLHTRLMKNSGIQARSSLVYRRFLSFHTSRKYVLYLPARALQARQPRDIGQRGAPPGDGASTE